MSFVLNKIVRDGNGVRDMVYPIAVAHNEFQLEQYCLIVIGSPIGEPKPFTWDDFYLIEPSNLVIL